MTVTKYVYTFIDFFSTSEMTDTLIFGFNICLISAFQRLVIEEQEKDPTAVDTNALTLGGAKKGKGRGGKGGRGGRGGGRGGKKKRGGPGNLTRMPVNF